MWIRRGSVSIMGAVLHASPAIHRVFAPSSHSLPAIQHLRNPFGPSDQQAVFTLTSVHAKIRCLSRLSPKFGNLWNYGKKLAPGLTITPSSTIYSFDCLLDSGEDPLERPLALLSPPSDWQSLMASLVDVAPNKARVVMVCGPRGSGKSTFTRLLTNLFISRATISDVALLDLDPGQPEYSPPGDVSLIHQKSFNFGPPYTHPLVGDATGSKVIRSHHVGVLTPRDDISHYLQCAIDLFRQYHKLQSEHVSCPLIINCCGFVLGTGLEILDQVIRIFPLTDIAYMSIDGPAETINILKEAATHTKTSFHTLHSQPCESVTRSPADLRLMQTLSYFHMDESEAGMHRWNLTPLHLMEPTELRFAGPQQTIEGILILGDEIHTDFLLDVVDGSILALVAIEDETALSGYSVHRDNTIEEKTTVTLSAPNSVLSAKILSTFPQLGTTGSSIPRRGETIPYIILGNGANPPFDPAKTHTIGQVLVRGIDRIQKVVQVITPISKATIEKYHENGIKIFLVRGQVDTPSWAYLEEYYVVLWRDEETSREEDLKGRQTPSENQRLSDALQEASDATAWAERTPWVKILTKHNQRHDRVWKARRNLISRHSGKGGGRY